MVFTFTQIFRLPIPETFCYRKRYQNFVLNSTIYYWWGSDKTSRVSNPGLVSESRWRSVMKLNLLLICIVQQVFIINKVLPECTLWTVLLWSIDKKNSPGTLFRWKVPFVYFELWFVVYLYIKFPGTKP